jgi:hypothetical protein
MTLLGLRDDYTWDGRAIEQILDRRRGGSDRVNWFLLDALGAAYKQLNAPFGSFGLDTLDADTSALSGTSSGDARYVATDGQLQACESARSALVPRIQTALLEAETGQRPLGDPAGSGEPRGWARTATAGAAATVRRVAE